MLKAEIAPVGGRSDRLSSLLLTFDVGRILVVAVPASAPATAALSIEYAGSREHAPPGLRDSGEDEPWWRVLGQPLARVWRPSETEGEAVCLQFRADDQNPRVVSLTARGAGVAVRLETPPA